MHTTLIKLGGETLTGNGWSFVVELEEDKEKTTHEVTVSKEYAEKLGSGDDVEGLVKRSFEFLLAREPKESILKKFELSVIQRYFSDYESTITFKNIQR